MFYRISSQTTSLLLLPQKPINGSCRPTTPTQLKCGILNGLQAVMPLHLFLRWRCPPSDRIYRSPGISPQVYLVRFVCGGGVGESSHRKRVAAFVKSWVPIANHFIQHNLLSIKSDILSSNYEFLRMKRRNPQGSTNQARSATITQATLNNWTTEQLDARCLRFIPHVACLAWLHPASGRETLLVNVNAQPEISTLHHQVTSLILSSKLSWREDFPSTHICRG